MIKRMIKRQGAEIPGHPDLVTHLGPRAVHTLAGWHITEHGNGHGQVL